MEYESEEFETKEVEREVEEEVAIPQVKTMYRHQGQGMGFAKGEIFILVSKKNKDWWAVRYVYRLCINKQLILMLCEIIYRRQNGQEGFVPANYVKEVEPLKMTKKVKRKEMVSVPVKVVISRQLCSA